MKTWAPGERLASARRRLYAKRSVSVSGCWKWTGSINKRSGYGHIQFFGASTTAHRVSWVVHFGAIPDGDSVLHACDNRACINPEHLFLGTDKANADDKIAKGRLRHGHLCGEANTGAKLDQDKAAEIRRRCGAGESTHKVAASLGVDQALVWRVWRGKSWRYASGTLVMSNRREADIGKGG